MTQHIQTTSSFSIPNILQRVISNDSVKESIPSQQQHNTEAFSSTDFIYQFTETTPTIGYINYQNQTPSKKGLSSEFQKKIKTMKMTSSSQCCVVCQQHFVREQLIKKLPCRHIFHRQCIKPWLKVNHNCPHCRFDLHGHYLNEKKKEETSEI